MKIKPIVKGLLTNIPFIRGILPKRGTGGTNSAIYCYDVWLKHLTLLWVNGIRTIPDTIAELGPGDSLGVGLASMLSGVNNYYALDVVEYANTDSSIDIFEELVALFKMRTARPVKGWPDYDLYLNNGLFPSHILTDDLLNTSLSDERIALIRKAIVNPKSQNNGISIKYIVPWSDENVIQKETVDVILSHATLEHVVDLKTTYQALYLWLTRGGMMSHQIDFSSHGLSKEWNGHWACSKFIWNIIVGKLPYLLNRQPCSKHLELMKSNGFEIVCHLQHRRIDGIRRSQLSEDWRNISDDDLTCSEAFIQARKKVN
jgi:hypothetical protein